MYIQREIKEKIKEKLFKGKIVILYGPRQVGKTTLCKEILKEYENTRYLSCDEPGVRQKLANRSSVELKKFLGDHKLIVIDEAQLVENIGLTLKLIVDNYPELQIIATGSSSFDLSNKINEPLTGRNFEFHLFPFSINELIASGGAFLTEENLENYMVYGMYPGVIVNQNDREDIILKLAADSLYKDIFIYQDIRKPQLLEQLLQLLALQVGNEVSFLELSRNLGVSKETVMWYVRLLEQAFIIFRLPPLGKNKRKEVTRLNKIYFYDLGLRNSIIQNLNSFQNRTDVGNLFENFFIVEMIKKISNEKKLGKFYFWRTKLGSEIDLVFEKGEDPLVGFECKWKKEKMYPPKAWKTEFPDASYEIVTKENVIDFLIKNK